ncbi:MAG: hypothetical protein HFJ59_08400, partial [Clostridia bacterium]|nr:hypothetical protein [Clostridia bacterium]
PEGLTGVSGNELSSVTLDAQTNLTWKVDTTVLSAVVETYTAVYAGNDEVEGTDVEVPVAVSKRAAVAGTDYEVPEDLTGVSGNVLSTVVLPENTNLTWENGEEVLSAVKETYTAVYAGTDEVEGKEVEVPVAVSKRAAVAGTDYEIPEGLSGVSGNALSTVVLPENTNLTWKVDTTVLSAVKETYAAVYAGNDEVEGTNVEVPVAVSKRAAVEGTDYNIPEGLSGVSGNALSTVVLPENTNLTWKVDTTVLSAVVETYTAVYAGTDEVAGTNVEVPVAVSKRAAVAGIDYIIPENLSGTVRQTLSTVTLPEESNLVWVDENEVLSIDKSSYTAKYLGTDEVMGVDNVDVTVIVNKIIIDTSSIEFETSLVYNREAQQVKLKEGTELPEGLRITDFGKTRTNVGTATGVVVTFEVTDSEIYTATSLTRTLSLTITPAPVEISSDDFVTELTYNEQPQTIQLKDGVTLPDGLIITDFGKARTNVGT